jgi:dipeptidyl aminopeptidase/acylaminoacyl peptidase
LEAVYAVARPHHLAASPDGSSVAFVLDLEGTSDVWLVGVEDGRLTRLTSDRSVVAYWDDSPPVWSPNGSQLAYNKEGHVWVVATDGGPPRSVCAGSMGSWIDERHLVIAVERQRRSRLAVIDVDDPWPAPIGPTEGDVGRAQALTDGRVLAGYWPGDDFSRIDVVIAAPDGDWTTLVGHPDRRATGAVAAGERVAYVLEDGDWAGVFLTDLTGSDHRKIAGGERDFSDLAWLPDGSGLIAIATSRGRSDLVRVTLEGEVTIVSEGGAWQTPVVVGDGVVAVHESSDSAPRLILVADGGEQRVLFDGAPVSVRTAPHAKVERITYRSKDDLEIEGFLFRPADTSRPVPAVVYPHGGPTSYYGDDWDGHAQYFVDKGYAWLAINFRGSTTYGRTFERANHGDWGVGDVDDCIAAAHYLAGLDWVDRTRIAILGASYGSYLALASLVRKENPFACAVCKYGDCDILTSWAQGDREGREDLERMMGHPGRNREAYRTASPIHDVGRIAKPILIAHGERDARVHPRQSEELVAALDQIGATYEYLTYPTEAHGLLRREPQLHFHQRVERFLDWYLM